MHLITHDHTTYGVSLHALARFQPEQFEPDWWQMQHAITGQSYGRGITWFVRLAEQELVLRHYYRGGLLGKWLQDRYWFNGITRSRAYQEFQLLTHMHAQGLPVPQPWAMRVQRSGLFYRMDILLERIPQATDLVQRLRQNPLSTEQWYAIGQTVKRFHQAGIYHDDLNAHNILLDHQERTWLIDFDKGKQQPAGTWQQANLQRLQRSLHKEATLHTPFHWQAATDWQALLRGYNAA